MTIRPVVQTAKPATQPTDGPMARVIQEKLVPQSGSARFM